MNSAGEGTEELQILLTNTDNELDLLIKDVLSTISSLSHVKVY